MPTPALRLDFARAAGDTLATNRIVLDKGGPTYRMRLRRLPQATSWMFDLATTGGSKILTGGLVRDRTDVLLGVTHPQRPKGAVIAYDPKGRGDPGPDAWTLDDVLFLYLPDGFDPVAFSLYTTSVG